LASKFSCHWADEGRINDGSVKALLPGRGDLLPLARVGSRILASVFLAFAGREKNELVDEADPDSKTTANLSLITAGARDHGG
jgi:hypothetical protein